MRREERSAGLKFSSLLYEKWKNYAGEEDKKDFATIRDSTATFFHDPIQQ